MFILAAICQHCELELDAFQDTKPLKITQQLSHVIVLVGPIDQMRTSVEHRL
jgi:hypothetical protein